MIIHTYVLCQLDRSGEHFVRGSPVLLLSNLVGPEELHEAVAEVLDLCSTVVISLTCSLLLTLLVLAS